MFFHAHPDDEALLTGGTMARLAAEGHRVVLVVATAGERGLSAARDGLGPAGGDFASARGDLRVTRDDPGRPGREPDGTPDDPSRPPADRGATPDGRGANPDGFDAMPGGHRAMPAERGTNPGGHSGTRDDPGRARDHVGARQGEPGPPRDDLGAVRTREALASARALGCARVEFLGYEDSGLDGTRGFARVAVPEAAGRLAELLHEERADLLTTYDPTGGYGHPDHVQVHRVGALAAELAGTPRVWEATVDRTRLLRGLRLARLVRDFDLTPFQTAYTPHREITHTVDVRKYARQKRAALAAHATQTTGGDRPRTVATLLSLPNPLFRLVLGTEWYVERKRLRAR
ncbi:GlcNAc-PI de-N-acetylase [Saccharothrix australiensis]|uniref:GlcNAc-PI de-N-acetylase n=1 Tax=Saccharothrix australiensis TaxID=2072 RepID=A0A495W9E0_9PSEU|nr:GlcNAc-PI de-N-acetylase [Saccharothrix australiensis]